ncbi:hypothetical protein [Weeksella virosa]|uniref:Lipoprotein n=1 Tax=Weeksella virosa (strain ATCC 43766 / DSM 16922 / JCM 21250 / CCUG 30538 / CDC 9751 / IAM 14551 / NBRC 16016 / NCTC 11634 / CL345/78) TaxID=865938 RepID=F0NZC9_WEEVC|nr:hypothetical protein [Weeksella virosa]ADX67258.1 hypothetical protein Weevi_0539 [Weeksella virosa DSM 16922]MDK7675894.1 hypothetical protein [Weeksella virosa]SUP53527.1 Uncharacterised protein [Weeksella virosa]VEH63006.1 Uncharacterised protein [Weeksella virosa]
MKKIVFLASFMVLAISCNKKPGGNHAILPVTHPPVEVPSHEDHPVTHKEATTEEAPKKDSVEATATETVEKKDTVEAKK